MRHACALLATIAALGLGGCAQVQGAPPLVLEAVIALPNVAGRIDHLAIDPAGRRLIVAEFGNNSVDIVDLASGAVVHRIEHLREPQGLAFDLSGRLIAIAERGDGVVLVFDAASFAQLAAIPLGADADDVRVDARNGHVVVGYGAGGLAVIDLGLRAVVSRIPLPAHPEGFALDAASAEAFVNLPNARTIGVVDLDSATLVEKWRLPTLLWNFPMALDSGAPRLAAVFRLPARLALFNSKGGAATASAPSCGDADDVFFDSPRQRIYVACGAGAIDVFDAGGVDLTHVARVETRSGARTALFAPGLERLFVAAPAPSGKADGVILVLKPAR